PPSSWARRAASCSPTATTRRRSPKAPATPTSSATCATRSWRRSRCSRRRTPDRTCRRRSRSTPKGRASTRTPTSSWSSPRAAAPALLAGDAMVAFLKKKFLPPGTPPSPPYHPAIVTGAPSAEPTRKTVKLPSCRYLDDLPTHGSEDGHAFRDLAMEQGVHKLT